MLNSKPLSQLLFIDLETVPQHPSFYDMSLTLQELFLKRFKKDSQELIGLPMDGWDVKALNTEEWKPKLEQFYNNRAALAPEFLKIICISVGSIDIGKLHEDPSAWPEDAKPIFKHRTYSGDNEKVLLQTLYKELGKYLDQAVNPQYHLVAYNGFMFDFPVLMKRYIINGLPIPKMLDTDQKKEWNLPYLVDPKNSWRGTSFDGAVSLALLCEVLGVPSPKGDIDGSQVRGVYYEEKNLKRIADYCCQDIYRMAQCYLKMKGITQELVLKS